MDNAAEKGKTQGLEDVLTEKQVNYIINQTSKPKSELLKYELLAEGEGLSGFLGDHLKVILHVKEGDIAKKIHLFIKTVPNTNSPKTKFIDENHFFRRESLIFKLFEKMPDKDCPNPWSLRAYIHNDDILVLPDVSIKGYKTYPVTQYFDINHILVTLTSFARFHAAFINNQTQTLTNGNQNYNSSEEYKYFIKDTQFFDCPWLHAAAKTTANFLKEFSTNIKRYPTNLKEAMTKWFINASDNIKEHKDALNSIIHKDLWASNILFKYDGDVPINALLIDFQCARYAPPSIDVMIFLYFTTSRMFRERHETKLLQHYYSVFWQSVDEPTKNRLKNINYDREGFLVWCDITRLSGMLIPLTILPFILMSPIEAQKSFDDPKTFEKHYFNDRSDPIIAYARINEEYKKRVLEISEEFVERYLKI